MILGSLFVAIATFPFLGPLISEEAFMAYQTAVGPASGATFGIMCIFVIMGIGYKLTEHYGGEAIYGGVVAVASFLILPPQDFEGVSGVIPTAILGAEGMF